MYYDLIYGFLSQLIPNLKEFMRFRGSRLFYLGLLLVSDRNNVIKITNHGVTYRIKVDLENKEAYLLFKNELPWLEIPVNKRLLELLLRVTEKVQNDNLLKGGAVC